MSRENLYSIRITFTPEIKDRLLFSGNAQYSGSFSYFDEIRISTTAIDIQSRRSSKISLGSIFYNHNSSLYNQIIKSLLFYYASNRKFIEINNISISRTRNKKILESIKFKKAEFKQILNQSFVLKHKIEKESLSELFNENPSGKSTLLAISHLLIANTRTSPGEKFEKLWKSFNVMYRQIGNHNHEFQCLKNLRQYIIDHPEITKLTTRKITDIKKDDLRNNIRWREMILNNFENETKTTSFKDFVLRHSDKRIMEIILETNYGYREQFLKNKGYFDIVDSHIKKHINGNTKNDNEIVTFLTGKYMYFIRNKTFHGEKIDSTFRLTANKEEKELKFLNSILELYILDLINSNT